MILVTGATGFLGSELVKQLIESGEHVRALKRASSIIPPILREAKLIEWFEADLLDFFALEKAFQGITKVYHCAAFVSFYPEDKKKQLIINKEGTSNIVNLCLSEDVEKLIHVSSVAALGDSKPGMPVDEKSQWEFDGTQGGYSISKYESEMEVWRAIAEGLNAVIVNPSVIIGKNSGADGSGQIFERVKKGLSFYTSGSNGFVDVEDVAKAMIALMNSTVSAERFLINAENWTFKDLISESAKAFGLPLPEKKAKPWMLKMVWRFHQVQSIVNGKRYGINRETIRSSFKKRTYSNTKFLKSFPGFTYKPISQSIKETCDALKKS